MCESRKVIERFIMENFIVKCYFFFYVLVNENNFSKEKFG